MAKLRFDPDRAAADADPAAGGGELPDWLAALKPEGEPVARSGGAPVGEAPRPVAERRVTPPAKAHSHETAPAPSLLAEDDLPAWLRKLSESPAAPASEAPAAAPPGALPSWVAPGPVAAQKVSAEAPAPEAPPPVWAPRDTQPAAPEPTGAAIFAELTGAQVSGVPVELDSRPAPPARPALPWWWFAAAAVIVLLVVAVLYVLVMR
jgi:hypothetical protein